MVKGGLRPPCCHLYHTKETPTRTQERENDTPTPWEEASNCALQFGTGLTICEDYALEKPTYCRPETVKSQQKNRSRMELKLCEMEDGKWKL